MDVRTTGAVFTALFTIYACRMAWVYHNDREEKQEQIEKMKQDEMRRAQIPQQPHNRHHKVSIEPVRFYVEFFNYSIVVRIIEA
jgi:hypothetical protein